MSSLAMESFNLQFQPNALEERRCVLFPYATEHPREESHATVSRVRSDAGVVLPGHCRGHQFPSSNLRHALSCDPDTQLSLTQEELRRLLDAADYVERERALLLQSLQDLSLGEKQQSSGCSSSPQACSGSPVLLRDEGGLFRLVSCTTSPNLPYSAQRQKATPPNVEAEDVVETDHFRMFRFKVQTCRETKCHDWAECPYAHPGEKASRRDPRLFRYSATPCPDVKRSGKCNRGDACSMAHGVFECWLHPSRYRTQPCKDGAKCPRKVCFFAHSPDQLRLAPAAAAAAVADAAAGVTSCTLVPPAEPCCNPSGQSPPKEFLHSLRPTSSSPKLMALPSPSSILSPASSSPPASPPAHSVVPTPFTYSEAPSCGAGVTGLGLGSTQGMPLFPPHASPAPCLTTIHPQESRMTSYGCAIPMPIHGTVPSAHGMCSAGQVLHVGCVFGTAPAHFSNNPSPDWRGDEPDLTWVVNLIQDQ